MVVSLRPKVLQNGAFSNTFDLHKAVIGIENQFLVFFLSGRLRQHEVAESIILYSSNLITTEMN